NRVWVATTAREQAVLQVRASSAILTPNGDGRNDTVELGYDLLELTGAASVEVAVWDLSGRLVGQVYAGRDDVGTYERMWDGRDASGRLVPPGLYLYRVSVEADHQTVEQAGLLHVVY
ncbi:MAG: gliding motility-associated C-terminal domain-containing protein, partial [Gemmatimonadota bacterium]|nr:gliding motility-associated C-terminal domain-containing protein [Gemmatimonadota bacterium]